MMTGLEWDRIRTALDILAAQPRGEDRLLRIVRDYDVPNVSEKVVRIIMSYTDYVNRFVWHQKYAPFPAKRVPRFSCSPPLTSAALSPGLHRDVVRAIAPPQVASNGSLQCLVGPIVRSLKSMLLERGELCLDSFQPGSTCGSHMESEDEQEQAAIQRMRTKPLPPDAGQTAVVAPPLGRGMG